MLIIHFSDSNVLAKTINYDSDKIILKLQRDHCFFTAIHSKAFFCIIGHIEFLEMLPAKAFLIFKNTDLAHFINAVVLNLLGKERVDAIVVEKLRQWLAPKLPKLRERLLRDTRMVTGWIYEIIKQVCEERA